MSNITTYLKVNKADAHCKDSVTLTSGMAGAKIKFEFSSEWDGLGKTAVFTAGTVTKYVVLDETNICTIPAECLATPRILIVCGVYGTDGDAVIIPTVWASLGVIVEGTSVSGEEPESITPTLYDQVTAMLTATADELATVKETKVIEARATVDTVIGTPSVSVSYEWIDEDDHSQGKRLILAFSGLKGGKGDPGNPGYTPRKNIDYFDGDDGFSPAVSSEVIPNGHRVDITDSTHTESFNVMNGDDGISPTVTVETTETGSKIIITDRDGAKEVEILNGADGDDGVSPSISTSVISGGHRVTVTDATHTETFNVMDGKVEGITKENIETALGYTPADDSTAMIYKILTFDGTSFKDGETVLTFDEIKTLCLDNKHFVYAQYSNRLYIPQYVSGNNIFFQATYISSDIPQIHRISINNLNQVSQYNYNLAKDTDVPTIPVTDVQINGTSILADNVANIPLCGNNIKGICWTYGGDYGIGSTNGLLSLSKAQDGNITNRNNDYRPIVSRNLNFAVKSALTDANHITLTDAEKATVQSVLGIDTLLGDIESALASL